MSDEPILETLGKLEREAQEIPARWRALTEGRATADEIAALCKEAAAGGEAAMLWERFRPLDTGDEKLLAKELARRVQNDARLRRRKAAIAGAFVLATAASVFVAWLTIPAGLPRYHLEAAASDQPTRSARATRAIAEHHPGSALSLILRPEKRVDGAIAADAYLLREGKISAWVAPLLISSTGAVRLDGTISELLPGVAGEVTLLFALRRDRDRPLTPDEAHRAFERGALLAHRIVVRE